MVMKRLLLLVAVLFISPAWAWASAGHYDPSLPQVGGYRHYDEYFITGGDTSRQTALMLARRAEVPSTYYTLTPFNAAIATFSAARNLIYDRSNNLVAHDDVVGEPGAPTTVQAGTNQGSAYEIDVHQTVYDSGNFSRHGM